MLPVMDPIANKETSQYQNNLISNRSFWAICIKYSKRNSVERMGNDILHSYLFIYLFLLRFDACTNAAFIHKAGVFLQRELLTVQIFVGFQLLCQIFTCPNVFICIAGKRPFDTKTDLFIS